MLVVGEINMSNKMKIIIKINLEKQNQFVPSLFLLSNEYGRMIEPNC